jgi:DNA-directed RNA polymerase subunit RPC12/RpoP
MSAPFTVKCSRCSTKLKLKDASAVGKKARCPKCKTTFIVPAPPGDDESGLLNVSDEDLQDYGGGDEFGDPYGDDSPTPTPTPTRRAATRGRRKKSSQQSSSGGGKVVLAIGGGLLALALVCGLVFLGVRHLPGLLAAGGAASGGGLDTAWLPDDTEVVVQVRVADAVASPVLAPILSEPAVSQMLTQLPDKLGLTLQDVERVTVGISGINAARGNAPGPGGLGANMSDARFVGVVRTKRPLDQQKLIALGSAQEAQHAGKTFHRAAAGPGGPALALYFAGDSLLVLGKESDVTAAIDGGGRAGGGGAERFRFVSDGDDLVVAIAPRDKAFFDDPNFNLMRTSAFGPRQTMKGSQHYEGVGFALDLTQDFHIRMTARMQDGKVARELVAGFDEEMRDAKQKLQQERAGAAANPFVPKDVIDRMFTRQEEMLNSAKVSRSGNVVTYNMTMSGQIVGDIKPQISMAISMFSMMGGMGGGAGGFPGFGPGGNMPPSGVSPPSFGESPSSPGSFPFPAGPPGFDGAGEPAPDGGAAIPGQP